MRFVSSLVVLVISVSVTVLPGSGLAADVVIPDAYAAYFQRGKVKFDPVQQVLLAYRSSYDRDDPALAWVDADGRRGGRVSPLKEFAKGDGFDIWAVAAGPQSVVVSGVVQAGERASRLPPRHVILAYDLAGTLRRQLVVNPYHHHQIAVDRAGNIYAMGHRIDGQEARNLILKYSREGVVEREFFPTDLLPNVADATMPDGRCADNQLWVDGERLLAYMAEPDELFQFDLDGKLKRRTPLGQGLARLASDLGGVRAEIKSLAADSQSASVLAEVCIWGDDRGEETLSFAVARLSLEGERPQTLEPDCAELGTFQDLLGRSGDAILFLNRYAATILRR